MKKFIIILAMTLFAVTLNAQWYIGGEIGLNVHSDRVKDEKDLTLNQTEVGFLIAPKAGYYFNEKFAIGMGVAIGPSFYTNASNKDFKIKNMSVNWSVYPFARYSVFTYKKFALVLEGSIGVGGKHEITQIGKEKAVIGPYTLTVGVFNIVPILSYNFTDRLQLEAGLHFLNLGYNIDIRTVKDDTYNHKTTSTKHDFNIGFNSNNALIMALLRIGVSYKF